MALFLGKRPTFVAASLVFFVGCIWSSVSQSYESLLASRIVTAFAGGSTEALGAAIINVRSLPFCVFFFHANTTTAGPLFSPRAWQDDGLVCHSALVW